jgi:putative hydrolase of the HAD superfamily
MPFDLIAFDADDTLWHNEILYKRTQQRYEQLLSPYASPEQVDRQLLATETRNVPSFGYGIKSFTLSMIENAIELSSGRISAADLRQILEFGRAMLQAEIRPLEHAEAALARLAATHPLIVITKGDLLDQETKMARSGLARYIRDVEIVPEKTPERYRAILNRHGVAPERFLMVGNSLKSDILPVLALGAHAVYIPYDLTWAHEMISVEMIPEHRCYEIEHIGLLPELVARLEEDEEVST